MSDEPDIFDFAEDDKQPAPASPPPVPRDVPRHAKAKEPGTIDVDRVHTDERIGNQYEALLRKHDVSVSRSAAVQLLFGLLWCAGIVFIIGSLVYVFFLVPFFDFSLFAPLQYDNFACSGTMLVVALMVLPLLFWQEKKTGGEFLDEATSRNTATSAMGARYSPSHIATGLTELLLTGPRLVMQGLGKRGERQRDTAVITRAASLLGQLHNAGAGVSPKSLLVPGEDMATFDAAVHYLVKRDWAGRKADASKLWISSEAKRRMENAVKVR